MTRRHDLPLLAVLALALLAGCTGTQQADCTGGSTLCQGACVALASDNLNCGACGHACAPGLLCSAGACVVECQAALTACPAVAPTACVDTATDPANCGACGVPCASGRCAGGTCLADTCGDGVVTASAGEACDAGGQSDAASCNMAPGANAHRCQIARCGDGYLNAAAGEQCDEGGPSATCNDDCTFATCGDGKVNGSAGEQCDFGQGNSATGCCSLGCHINLAATHCP